MVKSTALAVFVLALAAVSGPWIRSNLREAHLKRRLAAFGQRLGTLQKERTALHARSNPLGASERAKTHIAQEFTVGAGKIRPFQFTPPHVPGTLIGAWRASGEGPGGADNSLGAFRLTDPSGNQLAMSQHESNGRFVVKISATGTYTFYFDNAGSFRTTPREILLKADFFAD
jgi:hypothetical protein